MSTTQPYQSVNAKCVFIAPAYIPFYCHKMIGVIPHYPPVVSHTYEQLPILFDGLLVKHW